MLLDHRDRTSRSHVGGAGKGRIGTRRVRAFVLALAFGAAVLPASAGAVVVTLSASKDNTLYESATGATSNGAGQFLFTGRTKDGFVRRGVIAFDVATGIPAGSTINSVTLQLNLSRSANNTARTTRLHRVLAIWGEGTSDASQNPGQGAASTTNDATWIHRLYPSTLWATPGGNFTPTASASTAVTGNGTFTWTSATMVADLQAWLDSPATNFGWLLAGDEGTTETSKRFDSRETGQAARRPALIVDYTPAAGTPGACCLPSGDCAVLTAAECANQSGTYQGDGTTCTPDPCAGAPVTVTLQASKDNTLYESATGTLSNGAGTKFLVSKNGGGLLRRSAVQFDLATIPAGATVQNATLTLYNVQTTNAANVTVHRASASWGEGTSAATGNEDAGAPATAGDATWIHRFYPTTNWSTAGGDFVATASATTSVGNAGSYAWTSAALVTDVQAWVDDPATHFGWILRGKESGAGNALKGFESRQSTDPMLRPKLVVTYIAPPPAPTGACCFANGTCDSLTEAQCSAAGGTYQGDGTTCTTGLCPLVLTPYVDALPRPAVATPVSGTPGGAADYVMNIVEISQRLHRDLPPTRLWGYAGSYPGPTIEASTGQPVNVTWVNDLRDSLGALRTTHFLPVDLCMDGPDSAGATARVVSHLHGGHVPAAVDGYPESTMLPGEQVTYAYPNNQQAGPLWYHDHAMGITRLNVMMGLAGFYLVRDAVENALDLPADEFEIALAIQDRSFNADGSLQYPAMWMDHFHGDKMLVNGKVWPFLEVKQGKYRFRLLDGCNSRVLRLALSNGASFEVIGNDAGLLPAPVSRTSLLLSPGERAEVVIDFAGYPAGTQIVLTNDAPAPFPGSPGEGVIPNVMRFEVVGTPGHVAPLPGSLRPVPPIDPLESALTRDFVLRKTTDPCAGSIWMINDLPFDDITEYPVLGTTEIWRFLNESGISHPMHMHLVSFQILDRQPFVRQGGEIVVTGPPVSPDAAEAGWKDTAIVGPNEILRVIARFEDYAGRYAYHCHILEHEDNEMMRQFRTVQPPVVSIGDALVTEGDSGPTNATFTVTLSNPVQGEVRVVAFTENGTATAGADYVAAAADTVVFPPLVTQQTMSVPVLGDLMDEFDETFLVRLAAPRVAVLGDSVGAGTITDDDAPPTFSVNDVSVAEGNADTTLATFTVALSAPSGKQVTVQVGSANGTATAGEDYLEIAPPVLLSFSAGDTTLTRGVSVGVIGDAVVEPDESFFVHLSDPQNATLADSSGLGTIVNDEGVPVATVNDVSTPEGDAGPVNATFTLTLSAATVNSVRVVVFTEAGTASEGPDYVAVAPDTVLFPPLATQRTVTVSVLGDLVDEFDEIYRLRLAAAFGAVVGDSVGVGTIVDDDAPPALSVNDVSVTEGNADTTFATFAVSLAAHSEKPVQVLCWTRDGTAAAGADYVAIVPPGTVTFAPEDTALTRSVVVRVICDTAVEANETFFLDLSAPIHAVFVDSIGQGTILDDDVPSDLTGEGGLPTSSYLGAGTPSPFTSQVTLRWGLHVSGSVEISIFDVRGRLVRQLAAGRQGAGHKTLVWDGRNETGRPVANGVYLVRMRTREQTFRRPIVRLR